MKNLLLLSWRSLCFQKLKTAILILALTLTFFLPLAVHLLIEVYYRQLLNRAESTPFIIGAKKNRYDLVLDTLYFKIQKSGGITLKTADEIKESGLAEAIPIYTRFTAHKLNGEGASVSALKNVPLVGTNPDYYTFRKFSLKKGGFPGMLGEALAGARVAEDLDLRPGDFILTDQKNLYDISTNYPLKIKIVGILNKNNTADDSVFFADIKTAYIAKGLGHGHQDLSKTKDPSLILQKKGGVVMATAKLLKYNEITEKNIGSFHFHGSPEDFPLSSVIVLPHTEKSGTLLYGRYLESKNEQILVPQKVIEELMGNVFKIRRFFDYSFFVFSGAVLLFMGLTLLLSARLRQAEFKTLSKIGAPRAYSFYLLGIELALLIVFSIILAGAITGVLLLSVPELTQLL